MRPHAWLFLLAAALPAAAQTCVFSLSPTSAQFTAAGGNDTVTITQVSGASNCARTATSNANWITISFGTPGTGNGTVGYTVQSNPFTVERTGTLTIAGQAFTVTQAAGSCTYSLSPSSASIPAAGGSGSFNLTASTNSCPWAPSTDSSWITITTAASGAGTTTVRYTAAPNLATASRTGTIGIGGLTFTVTQPGTCAFTLSPASATASAAGGSATVALTASASSCAWTVASNNPDWITVSSAASGSGNATVSYAVAANTTLQDRSGSITIAGTGFNILQTASSCTFALSNSSASFPASGGIGGFYVSTTCPWTPSSNADWIVITSGAVTGSGAVTFLVGGNTGVQQRSGYISVGNVSYTVKEDGVACAVALSTNAGNVPAPGGVGSISVIAADGCSWAASTTAPWLSLSNAAGSGNADVVYTVAANTTPSQRTAIVTVANQKFTLTQDAAQCDIALAPQQATIPASGGTGSFTVGTSCDWTATPSANWITISSGARGSGGGAVNYSVAPNTSSDPRTGSIRVGSQVFTLVESGLSCNFTVTPAELTISGRGGKATAQVSGDKGCKWEPSKDQDWLTIDAWSSINGTGSVTVSASANPNPSSRQATLSAGGQAIAVTQGPLEPVVSSTAAVLNAASFQSGPVAPGEIVTIFGSSIGPLTPVGSQLDDAGQHIVSTVGGVQVWFDQTPAPLIYVSAKQVSIQVPYALAGKQTTQLKIVNQGVESNPLTVPVAPVSPAIFTLDSSGKGQGAILNQDNSVNGAGNAAARNSIVQIFATGEGQTRPPGEDGRITGRAPLPSPQQPVTVTIGGQTAAVVYAGAAPGAIAGLLQVNARIPANVTVGNAVPVVIRVGNAASPAGVTMAVK